MLPPSSFRLLLLFVLLSAYADANPPPPPPHHPSCPPFLPPPPAPSTPAAGVPHCPQIWCSSAANSSKYSLVTFNNISNNGNYSFVLLDYTYATANRSLLISPYFLHSNLSISNHSSLHLAHLLQPIDLSGSSFRVSNASCANLSALHTRSLRAGAQNCSSGTQLSELARDNQLVREVLQVPASLLNGCRAEYKLAPSDSALHSSASLHNSTRLCRAEVADEILTFLRSGFRVDWDASLADHSACVISCKAAAGPKIPSSPVRDHHATRVVIIGTALFAAVCFSALAMSAAAFVRRNAAAADAAAGSSSSDEDPMSAFLRHHCLHLRAPLYTYDQLHASTAGFDPKRKLGDGGFGSVYLAHMTGGRLAAVKRLHRHHNPAAAAKYFCNELLILSSIHHPNLVRLHGYCPDPRALLLVYDYVPNGTLADHLHKNQKRRSGCPFSMPSSAGLMPWLVRVDVALQVASALEYLHFSVKPPVVHRDVTSSNIFIGKEMRIKLGDFGLSRLLNPPPPDASAAGGPSSSEHYVCTGPQGTPGYLDPDYHRSFRLTEKSDVYSFGVVLLELITGMKAVDTSRDKREVGLADMVVSRIQLGQLHKVIDPALVRQGQGIIGTVEAVAELAFRCLAADKDDRPDAKELVEELKRIRGKLQATTAPKPADSG